jgi:prolipoprotein diacylglyceryltransferase
MSLPLTAALVVKFFFWLLALVVFIRMSARHFGMGDTNLCRLLGAILLGSLAGSKLVFLFDCPGVFLSASGIGSEQVLAWIGGDSTVGALLGGRLGLWLVKRRESGTKLANALSIPVASALLVLSVGAFFWALRGNGYGGPTALPWGVNFGDGMARHPVMLYEAAFLGSVVWLQHHRRTFDAWRGGLARQFIFAYCTFNLLVGFLKPPFNSPLLREALEPAIPLYAGLMTGEQWVCALVMVLILPGLSELSDAVGSARRAPEK